jgi:hypothetical protein
MIYTNVQNPTWNRQHHAIVCDVTFDGLGTVPFSATPTDTSSYTVEIYNRCIAGDFGPIHEYVVQPDEGPQPIPIKPLEEATPI